MACPRTTAPSSRGRRRGHVAIALTLSAFAATTARAARAEEARPDAAPASRTAPAPAFPPMLLPYADGEPVLPGYRVESRATRSYVVVGGSLLAASWLTSLVITGTVVGSKQPDAPRVAPLAIPFFGPFITIGTAHTSVAGAVPLSLDGIAQIAGATLVVAGVALPEKVLVFNTLSRSSPVRVTARLEPTPSGAAVAGTF